MLNKLRRFLFKTNVTLGDVNAVVKGKVGRRLVSKYVTHKANAFVRSLLK